MSETAPNIAFLKAPFPQFVIPKSPAVNLEGVNDRLIQFLSVLGIVHQAIWNCPLVVTSAKDQEHGTHSKHFEGKAVDIRVTDITVEDRSPLLLFVTVLCDRFQLTVFDERNLPGAGHFHVEVPE